MQIEVTPAEEIKLWLKGKEAAALDLKESVIILKSKDNKHLIAGYASINIVDREGERVNLTALNRAFKNMMANPSRRNYNLHHSNIQVGELLWEATDAKGFNWKAGVDFDGMLNKKALKAYKRPPEEGLFVICELFSDTVAGKEVIKDQNNGKLLSFSIGGRVLPGGRTTKCDDDRCWTDIIALELAEVTGCKEGVNQGAKAFILKSGDSPIFVNDFLYANNGSNPYMGSSVLDENILIKIKSKKETKMNDMMTEAEALTEAIGKLTEVTEKLVEDKLEKAPKKKELTKVKYIWGKPKQTDFEKEDDFYRELGAYHTLLAKIDLEIEGTMTDDLIDKESYRECMAKRMRDGEVAEKAAEKCKLAQKAKVDDEEDEDEKKAKKKEDNEDEEEEDEDEEEDEVKSFTKPEKKSYKSEEEYNKALADYNKLVADITKELTKDDGKIIKKSLKTGKDANKPSIKTLIEKASKHDSFIQFLEDE